ncbi:hypothetical protein QE361_002767 [Sphingomonas sp. SORGH_AS802]|uniref:hypothetical protein n=1 Tax=unclassified Sphingomonas TaxID=196159 RepID=UPI00286671BF|nr:MULTISPECIES: hypothetical protein [unclassified Sphingomonas]MDR6126387.1 hypothetical protein [Sphingomonas sp. SORGH_AS_0438]MDR6135768.1 hypothetical protein [Sphingomonas sp. SORGH_AS_0802]
MTPAFTDPAARRRWDAYFSEVDRLLARADADVAEMRGDLEAHVVDSMADASGGNEGERLDAALSRLGRPIDYLRPLLADEMLERGTRTYSPITIARGLSHAIMAGSRRAVIGFAFGLGYLLLAIFTGMALLKPLWGEHVGVFRYADGTVSAGIVAQSDGARELLGWWSIPIALLLAALLYVALTKGLRALRQRR